LLIFHLLIEGVDRKSVFAIDLYLNVSSAVIALAVLILVNVVLARRLVGNVGLVGLDLSTAVIAHVVVISVNVVGARRGIIGLLFFNLSAAVIAHVVVISVNVVGAFGGLKVCLANVADLICVLVHVSGLGGTLSSALVTNGVAIAGICMLTLFALALARSESEKGHSYHSDAYYNREYSFQSKMPPYRFVLKY
jgi:hypothetical protein